MSIWFKDFTLNELNGLFKNTLPELLNIEFTDIGSDSLVARMPVDSRTHQPAGIMHGGASCVLAETIGSVGAGCCIDPEKFHCVGLDINTNHIRAISSGIVTGIGKSFHIGRSTQVWGIDIFNEQQKLISVTRLTVAVLVRDRTPAKSE
jgi:uncharacterized protein (TIGR00369 family)